MEVEVSSIEKGTSFAGLSILIVTFLTLNSSLNLLNKWTLGHFGMAFPLILTSAHMGFSFFLLGPFALKKGVNEHRRLLKNQWKGLLCIGSFMALNIALNNISLLYISLSLNQIIRSSIPVVTSVISIFIERKRPTKQEVFSLSILTLGVMIAVWEGSVSGRPFAITLCILGTISNGLMMTLSSKLMSEKLDVVRLTFYTAPVSLVCLCPFLILMEVQEFKKYVSINFREKIGIIILGCINALSYNLVHASVIKKTSAVTSTVLGQIKIVGLLFAAAIFLEEKKDLSPKMLVGCFLALFGFVLFSRMEVERLKGIASKELPIPYNNCNRTITGDD